MDSIDSTGLSSLGSDVRDILEQGMEWPELAKQFDVSRYHRDDEFTSWHHSTQFEPMFMAYLYARVEDISTSTLPNHLEDNPELARAFGFDHDALPSESTFRPCRLQNRFSELETETNTAVREIRRLAAECGAPIGCNLGSAQESTDSQLSERSINRLLRGKSKKILNELQTVAFPAINLPRPDKPVYDTDELLNLESVAAMNREAANGSGETLGDKMNPNPDMDDPFYEDGPSGETLIESVKRMSVDEITETVNDALEKTYTRAKPTLTDLNQSYNVLLAIDITYVAYWGETEGLEWLQGAPDDKEYRWCHKFATAIIVGENTHFTVGVQPLGSVDHADNGAYPGDTEQSYHCGDVVRRLIDRANEYVDIRTVFADREFYASDVLYALEDAGVHYVIPAPKRRRLKRKVDRFDATKRGFEDDDRDVQMHVHEDYTLHGEVKGQMGNTRVKTNLVLLPPDEDTDAVSGPQPFVTNLAVSDELRIDRRETARKINRYNNRATIENSYSSIKQCAAWTTSKAFEVRWFHFAFACVIYNLWLLVDFLTQERIGVIETQTEPRITLKRFLRMLDRELVRRR